MELLWVVMVGAMVGMLARWLLPGRELGGLTATALLGVLGAFVAYGIGRSWDVFHEGEWAALLLTSLGGAVLVLFVYRVLANPSEPRVRT